MRLIVGLSFIFLLFGCSKSEVNSFLITPGTMGLWSIIAFLVFVAVTISYLFVTWKKLSFIVGKNASRKNEISFAFQNKFWKDFRYLFPDKFYEILGFGLSSFALLFVVFSMIDTRRLNSYKFESPDISVTLEKYKLEKKDEFKLVIEVKSKVVPRDCRIEFIPIFRVRHKNLSWALSKDPEDFSHKIPRKVEFGKDNNKCEIVRVRFQICEKPSYLPFCEKMDAGEAELARLQYKIYGRIGLTEERLLKEGGKDVI